MILVFLKRRDSNCSKNIRSTKISHTLEEKYYSLHSDSIGKF